MKDPSSPMDVCPFCGKAFKRLKSHLPHCKMAETKRTTPDKSVTAAPLTGKRAGAITQNQDPKVRGKSKMDVLLRQDQQDKTMRGKVGRVSSGSRLPQQKAAATIEYTQKALQTTTRSKEMVKERGQDQEAPSAPVQQAPVLGPSLQMTVPAPTMTNTLQTVRDQVNAGNLKGAPAGLSLHQWISEEDTGGGSGGVRDQFQGRFQEHLDHSLGPSSHSGSSNAVMVFGWSTSCSQERVKNKAQIPAPSPTVYNIEAEIPNTKALRAIEKSAETKMDALSPAKAVPIGLLPPVEGPLGLQGLPQLYNNYVQLGVVPGRPDQWDPHGRGTRTPEPIGPRPEHCKTVPKESVLENQSLMDVRLGELPAWFASRRYSPKRIPESIENAWRRYYNKYINVRKGGAGGLAMLLAGYCALSYTWNYHHIKQDRWRKYH